jgi:hypothetical protein
MEDFAEFVAIRPAPAEPPRGPSSPPSPPDTGCDMNRRPHARTQARHRAGAGVSMSLSVSGAHARPTKRAWGNELTGPSPGLFGEGYRGSNRPGRLAGSSHRALRPNARQRARACVRRNDGQSSKRKSTIIAERVARAPRGGRASRHGGGAARSSTSDSGHHRAPDATHRSALPWSPSPWQFPPWRSATGWTASSRLFHFSKFHALPGLVW